jgi:hypothetical protein
MTKLPTSASAGNAAPEPRRPTVAMSITGSPSAIDCTTCGMHMSTEGSPDATPGQPFGMAVDSTGAVTALDNSADLLTQYANTVCTQGACPHRTGGTP